MTRPPTLQRAAQARAFAVALAALLACGADALQAHGWSPPSPGTEPPSPAPLLPPTMGNWDGVVWSGPETGASATPAARRCATFGTTRPRRSTH